MEVEGFYDQFATQQLTAGVHRRHIAIFQWLKKLGLKRDNKVLEIGCGIGSVTGLILNYVSRGQVIATDISGSSIDVASKRLKKFSNLTLWKGDIIDYETSHQFDVIVLPDVIEHIPLVQHELLFAKISKMLAPRGFVLIHIPEPFYLEHQRRINPDTLQIIDQPIYLEGLLKNLRLADLNVEFLCNYSIWNEEPDYQVIKLERRESDLDYSKLLVIKETFINRLTNKVLSLIGVEKGIIPL